jgi:SAM-dependent methyltransferase
MAAFRELAPAFLPELERTRTAEPETFERLADAMLPWAEAALGTNWAEDLVNGYCEFVVDVNRAQLKYEKVGAYESKSFAEVYEKTYSNAEFMQLYHWGVYLTTFAWLHHLRIVQFFEREFLTSIANAANGRTIVDLGAGSGIWHLLALSRLEDWRATAIDISAPSIERSQRMAATTTMSSRVDHVVADAMTWKPPAPAAAGISCFLLEHLETPERLLSNLAACLDVGMEAFVTCAVTAAEIDHIYEFKSESEVVSMCERAGFRVRKMLSSEPSSIAITRRYLPRSLALVLQKKRNQSW